MPSNSKVPKPPDIPPAMAPHINPLDAPSMILSPFIIEVSPPDIIPDNENTAAPTVIPAKNPVKPPTAVVPPIPNAPAKAVPAAANPPAVITVKAAATAIINAPTSQCHHLSPFPSVFVIGLLPQ